MIFLNCQNFDGNNGFTDNDDNIQVKGRNVTWFNEFAPSGEELLPKFCYGNSILWGYVAQLQASMIYIEVGN